MTLNNFSAFVYCSRLVTLSTSMPVPSQDPQEVLCTECILFTRRRDLLSMQDSMVQELQHVTLEFIELRCVGHWLQEHLNGGIASSKKRT